MKKLSNTEAELLTKKNFFCCLQKKNVVLNGNWFSYFRPFAHDIITQNTTHSNIYIYIYLYRGHPESTSLGNGEGVDKESNKRCHRVEGVQSKKWVPSHKFFHVLLAPNKSIFAGKFVKWEILFSMSSELRFVKWVTFLRETVS